MCRIVKYGDNIMEFLDKFSSVPLLIFNRNNIKKYLIGEFDLREEELEKIQEYIEITWEKQIELGKKPLIRQIEQRKIPYIKELSISELEFLFECNIDLTGLLTVIYAKGGVISAMGSIFWNESEKRYEKVKFWNLFPRTLFAAFIFIFLLFLFYLIVSMAFPKIEQISNVAYGVLFILATAIPVLMFNLFSNIENAGKVLKKKYPDIFIEKT